MPPQGDIPLGLCQCGCGANTPLAKRNDRRRGLLKGQPVRWINGHQFRKPIDRYAVVDRGYKTPCWEWQGRTNGRGYGRVAVNGKVVQVHRYYFEQVNGPLPPGLVPDHLCRNRICINPEHMEAVTVAVNNRRGVKTKLTEDRVMEIRNSNERPTHLARRIGIDYTTVWRIRTGRGWKGVGTHG